jgi:tousled-like kinase
MFENEEKRLKEQLYMLEKEKCHYLLEYKKVRDEEASKFCGVHRTKTYTVLSNRYLILSILGKGGFSEVYKAFDLDNCIEVACKIHHFDDSWSDQVKDDYIKHALRENEIHKELGHRRVVKHHDTVEIDHNSFCTILELCSGPDLYNYLKENKQFQEKEAKLIIS